MAASDYRSEVLKDVQGKYKRFTNEVANWLRSTARSHGFPGNLHPSMGHGSRKNILSIDEFLAVSGWISASADISVDAWVIRLLDDAIANRERCCGRNGLFAQASGAFDEEDDRRHAFFVAVLGEAKANLERRVAPEVRTSNRPSPVQTQGIARRPGFHLLQDTPMTPETPVTPETPTTPVASTGPTTQMPAATPTSHTSPAAPAMPESPATPEERRILLASRSR